jgi:hypothetical protein
MHGNQKKLQATFFSIPTGSTTPPPQPLLMEALHNAASYVAAPRCFDNPRAAFASAFPSTASRFYGRGKLLPWRWPTPVKGQGGIGAPLPPQRETNQIHCRTCRRIPPLSGPNSSAARSVPRSALSISASATACLRRTWWGSPRGVAVGYGLDRWRPSWWPSISGCSCSPWNEGETYQRYLLFLYSALHSVLCFCLVLFDSDRSQFLRIISIHY